MKPRGNRNEGGYITWITEWVVSILLWCLKTYNSLSIRRTEWMSGYITWITEWVVISFLWRLKTHHALGSNVRGGNKNESGYIIWTTEWVVSIFLSCLETCNSLDINHHEDSKKQWLRNLNNRSFRLLFGYIRHLPSRGRWEFDIYGHRTVGIWTQPSEDSRNESLLNLNHSSFRLLFGYSRY